MSMCLVHGLVVLVGGAHFMFITYRIYSRVYTVLYTESFAGVSPSPGGSPAGWFPVTVHTSRGITLDKLSRTVLYIYKTTVPTR